VPVETGLETKNPPPQKTLNQPPTGLVPVETGLETKTTINPNIYPTMQPIYTARNATPAYQLNWGLTLFWRMPPPGEDSWLDRLKQLTEPDGVRIMKYRLTTGAASQFFISSRTFVSPAQIVRSVKGRLQYLLRKEHPKAFQRNYGLRSIGSVTRQVIEDYIADQLGHHRMADARVQKELKEFQKTYLDVDLSVPRYTAHGQYTYNLHIVIVNDQRWREVQSNLLRRLGKVIEGAAAKHGHELSRLSLLADHLHLSVGCKVDQPPEDVVLGYMNNCAYVYGMKQVYQYSYYVGTFGEYDRGAV